MRLNVGEQYVFIRFEVMPDRIFSRDGNDVLQNVFLPVSKILLGGAIKIHSLTDKQFLKITLPECTEPNTLLRLKGQGIRDQVTNKYGDMLITVSFFLLKTAQPFKYRLIINIRKLKTHENALLNLIINDKMIMCLGS